MYDCMCLSPPVNCAYVGNVSYKGGEKAKNEYGAHPNEAKDEDTDVSN